MISWVIPPNGTKMTSTAAAAYHNHHRGHDSSAASDVDAAEHSAARRNTWSAVEGSGGGGESSGVSEERSRKRSAAQMMDGAEYADVQPEESEDGERPHSTDSTVAAEVSTSPLPPPATSGGRMESFLEAQKAFHRFTSQLSAGSAVQPQQQNHRNNNNNNINPNVNPFLGHFAGLPPIIAAVLQQQQQNMQQQLMERGVESKALLNCHRHAAEAAAATANYLLGGGGGGEAVSTRYGNFAQEHTNDDVSGGGGASKIGKLAGTIGEMLSASRAAADAERQQRRRGSATSSRRGSPTAVVGEEPLADAAMADDCGLYHHLMDDGLDEEEDDRTAVVNYCGGGGGEPQDLRVDKRSDADDASSNSGTVGAVPGNWSYEEQFKQLYELSDDVKRKEWLDDWLNFMHRIGKPVTRIPIMAKQVLDLYELYHLVVRHGGLVEIINKKLWREITKGLNLPNSITSAAFTLRTQYQKYLYDYECEHENLSRLSDLTAAIEGNRRESRRTNPSDTPTNTSMQSGHNGYDRNSIGVGLSRNQHSRNSANDFEDLSGTTSSAMSAAGLFPYALLGNSVPPMMATLLGKHIDSMKDSFAAAEANCNPNNLNVPFASSHRQLEMFQRAAFDAMNAAGQQHGVHTAAMGNGSGGLSVNQHPASGRNSTSSFADSDSGCCAAKKSRPDRFSSSVAHSFGSNANKTEKISKAVNKSSNSSPHMKLTSCTNNDGSMVVSMEFNGVAYQGVLFATNNGSSLSSAPATRALNTNTNNNGYYNNNKNPVVGEQTAGNVTLNSASEATISAAATAAASKFFSSMLQNVAMSAATAVQEEPTGLGNATTALQNSNMDEPVNSGSVTADNCDENNDENSHVINFVAKDNNDMSTDVGDSESMEVVQKNNDDFVSSVEAATVESECGSVMEDLKKSLALSSVLATTTSS